MDRLLGQRWWLPAMLAFAVLGRLSMFGFALSSDEGGLLHLAAQWDSDGASLYGDHWVDRPPLLVAFFAVADGLGGATALRLMGCGLAVACVLLAHRIGSRLGESRAAGAAAALAAAATSSPLFGAWQVDGELIAVPLVLGGLVCILTPTARAWWCAGLLGAAAMLVKQNFADVLIVGGVLLAGEAVMGRGRRGDLLRRAAALTAGALVMVVVVVWVADQRGTSPSELWDAVVTFRGEASAVIASSASASTGWRLSRLVLVVSASGAGLVVVAAVVRSVTAPRTPWALAAGALAAWNIFGILAGGGYWLHYMVGLLPAMVVGAGLISVPAGRLAGAVRAGVVMALVSTIVSTVWTVTVDRPDEQTEVAMGQWLATAAHSGDTATVLFGRPNILHVADLSSPYQELWSLPVRVRDSDLRGLTAVLQSRSAPTWLIASGRSIASWGIDSDAASVVVRERYAQVRRMCGFTVYLLDGEVRDTTPTPDCGPDA